jgi:hypothetical protein
MEPTWLKEVLFAGQTANGFKLGTTLALGWFWARVKGCRIMYRGGSMEGIDFEDVLAVAGANANEIELPGYLTHEPGEVYFYVVRCANRCGQIERTLRAATKAVIDNAGKLGKARPNGVVGLRAAQGQDGKVELVWTYNSMEQESGPVQMRVYSDGGTGGVDYQNPAATVKYKGRRFYRHEIESPEDGQYRFAVRAADEKDNENESMQTVAVEIQNKTIEAIEIVNIESI